MLIVCDVDWCDVPRIIIKGFSEHWIEMVKVIYECTQDIYKRLLVPCTEAAFHKEVAEFKQQGLEQENEEGLHQLALDNMPPYDPTRPLGV